jgi:hypothetical protein
MRRTKSQIRAEKIAGLVAEQDAYDRSVNEAMEFAAFAHAASDHRSASAAPVPRRATHRRRNRVLSGAARVHDAQGETPSAPSVRRSLVVSEGGTRQKRGREKAPALPETFEAGLRDAHCRVRDRNAFSSNLWGYTRACRGRPSLTGCSENGHEAEPHGRRETYTEFVPSLS